MAVHLHIPNDLLNNSEEKEAKIHWMPCIIKANDEANVSKYFEPNITESSGGSEYSKIFNVVRLGFS